MVNLDLTSRTLNKFLEIYEPKGLISIYLWGSAVRLESGPRSDIDAIGILSDSADFGDMKRAREKLVNLEPALPNLHINFFYFSELSGGKKKGDLARLRSAKQAVFDFPYWLYVCGKKFSISDFPNVSAEEMLTHQAKLTLTRKGWVLSGKYGDKGLEYFCKSLAWLCYGIHKQRQTPGPFSWQSLSDESTDETRQLVKTLMQLKSKDWNPNAIKAKLPYLLSESELLTSVYLS